MTTAPIIVASAVDEGYIPYALVVANSIAKSTSRRRPVEYHVLYCGPPEHWAIPKLEAFRRRGVQVVVHRLPNPWVHLGKINGFLASTFLRVAIPDVLAQYRRAIYLDVDAVVEDDLGELFDADLGENAMGAVQCVLTITAALMNGRTWTVGRWGPTDAYFELELGLISREQKLGYVQCAMQLLDLDRLRAMHYGEQIGSLAEQMRDRLGFVDQCATNKLLAGRVTLVDARWNISPFALEKKHEAAVPPELISVLRHQRDARGILHYGGQKPWRHPAMPGGWRWWRNAIGSGTFRFVVQRERRHWQNDIMVEAQRRYPRSYGLLRRMFRAPSGIRLAWQRTLSRVRNTLLDPIGTGQRVMRRLRGQNPDG